MSISPILECTVPFCGSQKEQTACSRNSRIAAIVLGIIFLGIGASLLSGAFGNYIVLGSISGSVGLILIALASCLRRVQPEKPDFSKPIAPPTKDPPLKPTQLPKQPSLVEHLDSLAKATSKELEEKNNAYQEEVNERTELFKKIKELRALALNIFLRSSKLGKLPNEIENLKKELAECQQTFNELKETCDLCAKKFKVATLGTELSQLSQIERRLKEIEQKLEQSAHLTS